MRSKISTVVYWIRSLIYETFKIGGEKFEGWGGLVSNRITYISVARNLCFKEAAERFVSKEEKFKFNLQSLAAENYLAEFIEL